MVLGQTVCKGAVGSELSGMKQLLDMLDLEGRIITVDALGCQKNMAQKILDRGGDYVMALKNNQKNLLEDVKEYFKDFTAREWQEHDKGHGRIEIRTCWSIDSDNYLQEHGWPGLKSISMVQSKRILEEKETESTRYYISSLEADAQNICSIARRHWSIGNKLHWVLDVTFNEDKACIRNDCAAENIAVMRKWALNIINSQRKRSESIRGMKRKASMSFTFLLDLLKNTIEK